MHVMWLVVKSQKSLAKHKSHSAPFEVAKATSTQAKMIIKSEPLKVVGFI